MKVKQLIEKLSKFDPNAKVLTYIDEDEAYGDVRKVKMYTNNKSIPYAKADVPKDELPFVLIEGWFVG